MKKIKRVLIGTTVGAVTLVVAIVVIARLVADLEVRYRSEPFDYWASRLTNASPAVQTEALAVVTQSIVPLLTNQMFADTNDSPVRVALVEQLNSLPWVHLDFTPNEGRRVQAVEELAGLGPIASPAIPALLAAVSRPDDVLCGPAANALVAVGASPEDAVPVLVACLIDPAGRGRPEIVEAVGKYGPKAKAAVPILVKLLQDRSSKEIVKAVPEALKKVDLEAATRANVR